MNAKFKSLLIAAIVAIDFAAYAALPEGCQRSPYLRGDGKAYIELDFPLTHEQTVTIEFVCRDRNGSQGILGARESATANNCGIVSGDPRLDGGWMRAFDTAAGEWYGLNKDMDWGAYCIMGGWVMGYVPQALMTRN